MFSRNVRKILSVMIAGAAMVCLAAPRGLAASPDKGVNVTFTASGTFASTQLSGNDLLELRGQPFSISVVGSSSAVPIQHGQNWAIFKPLSMTGTVYSGLVPNQPIPVMASTAAIDQTVGATEDIFQSGFPVTVVGIALTVRAHIILPGGTLTTALLRPFASVTLGPTAGTYVTYSNPTATTELAIQTGTLVATIPVGGGVERSAVAAPAFVLLAGLPAVKPRSLPIARL
jgi:hypothetical protein